jgi:hypothetical protein
MTVVRIDEPALADRNFASHALERFAREALGCQCPPEDFQRVEEDLIHLPGLTSPVRRLFIGGRLLIYLIPLAHATAALDWIGDWIAAALAERDRRGMNRVRLVLGYEVMSPAETDAIESAFARLAGRDERVHLHLIPAASLAAALELPHSGSSG